MSLLHFATVTARHPSDTTEAIRGTIHQALPRLTRRTAISLIAFALLDLLGYGLLGQYPIASPYCYFSLILGVCMWLSEGHRALNIETERLCCELEHRQAEHDLDSMIRLLLDQK